MDGFWKILELEPTRNVSAIRRAYAQKTRICHPEEGKFWDEFFVDAKQSDTPWQQAVWDSLFMEKRRYEHEIWNIYHSPGI